jgi:hypothetical protein
MSEQRSTWLLSKEGDRCCTLALEPTGSESERESSHSQRRGCAKGLEYRVYWRRGASPT